MAAIMKCLCFSLIILASATFFSVADARRFNVGGNGVWGLNPKENYKTWAERNRFQVNDTLYLKYAKGSDSVQEVMKADYFGCNVRNPIKEYNNGESVVKLERSGPFYFISGNEDRCKKGQKMIVVVLAVRDPISPAKPPSSAQSPSPVSPISPAKPPSMAKPPKSPSPISPAKPPSSAQPPKSPSPISPAKPPAKSPPPKSPVSPIHPPKPSFVSPSHAPAKSPSIPSPKSPSPSSSTSPSKSPSSSPANHPKPSKQSPASSPSPSDTTPDSGTPTAPAPAPSQQNSASVVSVNSVMITGLSVAFTLMMFA